VLTFAALIGVVLAIFVGTALLEQRQLGLTFRQALLYTPLKLLFRIDDRTAHQLRGSQTPVVYAIIHHSAIDAALALCLCPDDTLHVLDPDTAALWWIEPYRALARTTVFDEKHVLINRRLKRMLTKGGRIAVYLPGDIEPEPKALKLFRAVARIVRGADALVVPVVFEGAQRSHFSIRPPQMPPRLWLPRITVSALAGETIAQTSQRAGAQNLTATNALFDRVALARFAANDPTRTIFQSFRDSGDRFGWSRVILEDTITGALTFKRFFIGARVLGKRFQQQTKTGENVGVLLPNANAVVISLLGLQSAGRVAAMLNYTAGPANIASAIKIGQIRKVICSHGFVEKAQLEDLVTAIEGAGAEFIWLEDVRKTISLPEKLLGALLYRLPLEATDAAKPAVILFTSGSEGLPKGVVLSHRNVLANGHQAGARVDISVKDTLFNVLPVFHSFGLTGGTILPLLYGVKLFLYPSPLHFKIIPQVAAKVKPTIMFGTDTFLAGYARTAKDGDFASIRFIVAGAEAVKPETRATYRTRFNTEILEGFGMTEAAPVVAVNSATHGQENTVGRLLPGMEVRLEPVEGIEGAGRMWVKGPNVMLGYMMADRPGQLQPLGDGWHDSGDIVAIDRQGFIAIRGRAKRFAKIAGEMVSLGAVEMLVQACWPEDRHAVISLPDKRKGERIVLLTTHRDADRHTLQAFSKSAGAIELMVPNVIIAVEDIPVLGSGKTDYMTAKEKALLKLGDAA
jgi:acyl-[acyl-carrier-protein]-phospholipid O-acyltransferase/long-chain-fatty-acid--[acyl-carrier-protein] ligase